MDDYMEMWQYDGYGDSGGVVPDNSYGAPAMTTSTPTGNGTGAFISGDFLGRLLEKGVNYAIVRDQVKMTQVSNAPIRAVQTQVAQAQATDSRLLFWLLIGAGIFYVVKNG